MHAFGLSRELCSEFLRKQCFIANLTKGVYYFPRNRADLKLYYSELTLAFRTRKNAKRQHQPYVQRNSQMAHVANTFLVAMRT